MEADPVAGKECGAFDAQNLTFEAYPNRNAHLGDLPISRAMPIRDRRMVGPWCFLDRYGPLAFEAGRPMNVPPHPHIGLQTVSWLLEGEVLHSDSVGSVAVVRPGGVNVMTAGNGIAHAEETPLDHSGQLNGVQLWVALPEEHRHVRASFANIEQVPVLELGEGLVQIFSGSYGGLTSPAPHYSEILGLDVQVRAGKEMRLHVNDSFEHAALLLNGDCEFEGHSLEERMLYYFGSQRIELPFSSQSGGRLLLIGGPPFPETILMWWNFVARTPDEIAAAREDWQADRRFGEVIGEHDPRLAAPELVRFARPNPAS